MTYAFPFSRFLPALGTVCLFAMLSLAAGCSDQGPPVSKQPELRFLTKAPFRFAAQGPDIVTSYIPPLRSPHVEHRMPLSPEQAMRTWAQDRITTTHTHQRHIRVDIREASVTETKLPTKKGITGFFTNEPEARYAAKANIAVQIVDGAGVVRHEASATAWRTITIPEKASLAERDQIWFELVEHLMQDMDAQLGAAIRQHLGSALLDRSTS
ncbi:hypothetical protein HEQ60_07095 [Haematospirillum sp. H1815]|uniref:hypothetical protein n=1 Tax=Haematospirillum sp. H1815 TaxID=2723108 RepID=UPI00143A942C|nr:hypothetical protein [Haematospirillum sp. H1815]NKD77525.1 hypothetical protein [Haematospirillum sp. H1815]